MITICTSNRLVTCLYTCQRRCPVSLESLHWPTVWRLPVLSSSLPTFHFNRQTQKPPSISSPPPFPIVLLLISMFYSFHFRIYSILKMTFMRKYVKTRWRCHCSTRPHHHLSTTAHWCTSQRAAMNTLRSTNFTVYSTTWATQRALALLSIPVDSCHCCICQMCKQQQLKLN